MARKLDRLQPSNAPGLPRGAYTNQQRVCEQVEALFDDIQGQITDIATALAAATAAQTAATAAQTTADAVKKTDKISGSWTSPGNIITAVDAGTDATVTVAAHTRKWGDTTSTSVGGHVFTGQPYTTDLYVYYDDPNQSLTSPTYHITTSATTAANNSSTGRVFVGAITTPGSGGAATDGGSTFPGGGGVVRPDHID